MRFAYGPYFEQILHAQKCHVREWSYWELIARVDFIDEHLKAARES